MLNICWQSYHLCLKILAVCEPFWNSYINFILYLIQSWTKIVGTLVHNSVFWRYSSSILPSPPFNVVLLWTRRANFIAYHVWLQHWFRGVGSVKCPSSKIVWEGSKKLPINLTKMLITLKRHKQMLWFFCDNKRVTSTIESFINFKIIQAYSTEIVVQS